MGTPPTVVDYRRSFVFEVPPPVLWEALSEPQRFEAWWGWLGELHVEGGGLVDGAVFTGLVSPPVPYQMRVTVHLDHCQAPRQIDASVEGDLRGSARLLLHPHDRGTTAEIAWRIEMMQRPMRIAARVAGPLLRWGHDRVVDMTVAGFRRQLHTIGGPDQAG